MPNELEALQRALKEERRIIAAICLSSLNSTVRISSRWLEAVDDRTSISTLQEPDGSLTITAKSGA